MKIYFCQYPDGELTWSNRPIKEAGTTKYVFEVSQEDYDAVRAHLKKFTIVNGELILVDIPPEEQPQNIVNRNAEERAILKEKISKGELSQEDIREALLKLL